MGATIDFFRKRLADKIILRLDGKLKHIGQEKLYHKSFGKYAFNTDMFKESDIQQKEVQGELLIEFNEEAPNDGIYYGFMLDEVEISVNDPIDQCFAAFIEHLEYALKKTVYLADNNENKKYWVFWLRDDNATIDDIISDMELIRDYFNQLVLFSKLGISKVLN